MAVEKLAEAVRNPRNHRYSASRGIPKLRLAVADLYLRKFGVELDPDTEVVTTIGAKEGLSHLMWVLLGPGRHRPRPLALVSDPPLRTALRRGGRAPCAAAMPPARSPPMLRARRRLLRQSMEAWESTWPKPRVIILSFPHNPTTACVDLAFMERMVAFAQEHDVVLVHDFAYADLGFDGYEPPSILQVRGPRTWPSSSTR